VWVVLFVGVGLEGRGSEGSMNRSDRTIDPQRGVGHPPRAVRAAHATTVGCIDGLIDLPICTN
jgi:hypothetical protein